MWNVNPHPFSWLMIIRYAIVLDKRLSARHGRKRETQCETKSRLTTGSNYKSDHHADKALNTRRDGQHETVNESLFPQADSMNPELPTDSEIVVGQLLVDGPRQARDLLLNAKSGCQRFVLLVASFGALLERCKLCELILCPILKIFSKLDFYMGIVCSASNMILTGIASRAGPGSAGSGSVRSEVVDQAYDEGQLDQAMSGTD